MAEEKEFMSDEALVAALGYVAHEHWTNSAQFRSELALCLLPLALRSLAAERASRPECGHRVIADDNGYGDCALCNLLGLAKTADSEGSRADALKAENVKLREALRRSRVVLIGECVNDTCMDDSRDPPAHHECSECTEDGYCQLLRDIAKLLEAPATETVLTR